MAADLKTFFPEYLVAIADNKFHAARSDIHCCRTFITEIDGGFYSGKYEVCFLITGNNPDGYSRKALYFVGKRESVYGISESAGSVRVEFGDSVLIDDLPEALHCLNRALASTFSYKAFVDTSHPKLYRFMHPVTDSIFSGPYVCQEQVKGVGAHINNGDLGHTSIRGRNLILYSNAIYLFYDHSDKTMAKRNVTDQNLRQKFDELARKNAEALLGGGDVTLRAPTAAAGVPLQAEPLAALADALAAKGHGLIMVMGKGGVGKTTIAAALAVGLVQRGHSVHLTTTDPAAHVQSQLDGSLPGLKVGRIDPQAETQAYIDKIMATRGKVLDDAGRALLLEDLQSPCTEEVAVFHAFSRVVNEARSAFVVLDTAPTGHSLLLMDATGAYHRQMTQQYEGNVNAKHIITPLMRLQDADMTHVVIVTLPEVTPVSQAAALQDDLRRARIEPWAWVINKSVAATGTSDPLLQARLEGEQQQAARIASGLAQRTYVLPWLAQPPVGVEALGRLVAAPPAVTGDLLSH